MIRIGPTPGSFLWLVAHDTCLNWRRFAGMLGEAGKVPPHVIAAVAIVISHVLAWPVAKALLPFADEFARSGADVRALAGILLALLSWMIAQSLFGAMRTLYDRGDLDLLMGSPLPSARIFAAKATAIATSTAGSIAVLVLPLANMSALLGRPHWLAIYPVLGALALIATSIAILVAIGLFFLVGARRARVVMQLTGAAIGGGFVLGAQVVLLLPGSLQDRVVAWFSGLIADGSGSLLASAISVPMRALLGHGSAIAGLLAVSLALFAAAVVLLAERFARASLAASGQASAKVGLRPSRGVRFRTNPGPALRRKEWRLLLRDPGLFAQVSLQVIYTLPMVIVLVKSGTVPAIVAIAPSVVVIVSQVAASLAWITVSGEDAPELIASAPVQSAAVDAAKLSAIAVPVAALLVLPVAMLALISPFAAVLTAVLGVGACLSTALLNIWHPMPGNRRGMLRRHSQSKLLALIEHIIALLWAVAVVLALMDSWVFIAAVILALAVLALAVPGSRARLAAWAACFKPTTKVQGKALPAQERA